MNMKKPSSMKSRLTRQFLLLLFGVLIIYIVLFNAMGIIDKITANNYKILKSQTVSVADQMVEMFRGVTASASQLADYTEKAVADYQNKSGLDWKDINGSNEALNEIYGSVARYYLDAVTRGRTTGIFVYLDAAYAGRDSSGEMSALYIRSNSPTNISAINYSSLMYYKGLTNIIDEAASERIALDQFHSSYYSKQSSGAEFVLDTMKNAELNKSAKVSRSDLGRWSPIFRHESGDRKIITYCEPIYDRDGNAVGVCGFELSVDYIISLIPNTNLPYTDSAYILADIRSRDGDGVKYFSSDTMIINGLPDANITNGFDTAELIPDNYAFRNDIEAYSVKHSDADSGYVVFPVDIGMYGKKSVYYDSQGYFLAGCAGVREIYALGGTVSTLNFITIIAVFILLGTGLIFAGINMSSKIENLSAKVSALDSGGKVALGRVNITEIDHLAKSFEDQSVKLVKNARHLSDVTALVGITVAAFEANAATDTVSFSDILYDVFGVERDGDCGMAESGGISTLPVKLWEEKFPMFMKRANLISLGGNISPLSGAIPADGGFFDDEFGFSGKWYRVRYIYDSETDSASRGGSIYGTMIEITKEIENRQKYEFERDYDPLTGILNRSSYKAKIQRKIDAAPGAVGAVIFCDLDGLKTINDTYGHKAGDIYIQTTAAALSGFEKYGATVARLAGDEFVVYLHGYSSKGEIINIAKKELEEVKSTRADIIGAGDDAKIRLSSGVAFYPADSSSIDELVKYADFAMNELKRSSKGGIRYFDANSYELTSHLSVKQSYLDIFLEGRRLRFAFQPILDVETCEVYGYKALMRPLIREVQNPVMLIKAAKTESKLYQVEKLVLETIFEWIRKNSGEIGMRMIFFNIMGTQNFRPDDWNNFTSLNSDYFKLVVCEITNPNDEDIPGGAGCENPDEFEEILKNSIRFRERGADVSINGGAGETRMNKIKPDIIKISRDVISGIDSDAAKQRVFENAVRFAKKNNAKIIASGIENEDELETVIMLGVDYVQGFIIGMPSFDIFDVPDKVKEMVKNIRAKYFRQ